MSVYPRDVVYTQRGVIHVHSTKVESSMGGSSVSISVSGLNGDGEMLEDVPVSNLNKNLLRANASERDALELFNHERRLKNLEKAVFECSDDLKALTRYRANSGEPWVHLVLITSDILFDIEKCERRLIWVRNEVGDCYARIGAMINQVVFPSG